MNGSLIAVATSLPIVMMAATAYLCFRHVVELRQRLRVQSSLVNILCRHVSLRECAPTLLATLCRETAWAGGAISLIENGALQSIATICEGAKDSRSQSVPAQFSAISARAWTEAKPIFAQADGTYWLAFPLIADDTVLGICQLYGAVRGVKSADVYIEAGKVVGAYVAPRVAHNEKALSDSELRQILDTAPDGVVMCDESGTIRSINKAAARMFGYAADQCIGQNIVQFIPAGYRTKFGAAATFYFSSAVQSLLARTTEVTAERRDGSTFPMEISVSRIHMGEVAVYSGTMRDISDRKLMEKRVSEFYSIVSHELRSPLSSIRGALGLIEGTADDISSEVRELVSIARRNCDRLMRLINDILDAKKIESGKLKINKLPLRAADLIFTAVESMQSFAAESKVSLVAFAENSPLVVGDADRIIQILTNFLSNSIKYSPEGAKVDIYLAPSVSGPGFVRFCVEDRGPGIPSDQLEKLFMEFQQLDSSDARAKGGTGLGLAISKKLVEQLDGSIGVDNKPGKGAIFWFELPAAEESALQKAFDSSAENSSPSRTRP